MKKKMFEKLTQQKMIKEWKFVLQFWNDALHLKKLFDFGKTNKSDDRSGLSSPVAWDFFLISSDFSAPASPSKLN